MDQRDGLKPFNEILEPDVRNKYFEHINLQTGQSYQRTIAYHYQEIERYHLANHVPDIVATQYDMARNIYVYAWFQYNFFNIAEAQVLIVLELAMKERVGKEELKLYISKRKKEHQRRTGKKLSLSRGIKTLMEYCRDHELVCNEGFTRWHQYATRQAYFKQTNGQRKWPQEEMKRTEEERIDLSEVVLERPLPDSSYNHVQFLIDHTNKSRNDYAHGSTILHNQVIDQFEMVSEFINQIFSK